MRIHIKLKHRQLLLITNEDVEEEEMGATYVTLNSADLSVVPTEGEAIEYEEEPSELRTSFGFQGRKPH